MCSNYEPVTMDDRLMAHFGVSRPSDVEPPESAFPGLKAFFIRAEDDSICGEIFAIAGDSAFRVGVEDAAHGEIHSASTVR